jgi:hypothetical protein
MFFLFLIYFSVGERLEYTATFSFLHLGSMILEIQDTITYNNTDCYLLSSILSSNQNLKFLFSLNDTLHVCARKDNLLPLFYEKRVHEGDFYNHSKIHFDHDDMSALYGDSISFELLEESRDILTFWYYLRTIPLTIGDIITLHIHESKENYEVNCFVSKKETISTSIGSFNTILVEPRTKEKGMFSSEGGMQIWYSDDAMRFPVQIKTKMNFGSILFKLKGVAH